MNLPNALTLLRLFLVPLFLIAVIYAEMVVALGLFVAAALTDLLDGYFARRLKQESLLGAYLDPVADKLLNAVAFVALAVNGWLPAWLAVLVLTRDLFIAIGVAVLYFSGQAVAAVPTRWGKQTTFLQMLTVGMALLWASGERPVAELFLIFALAGAFTVFSGVHYILSGVRRWPLDLPPEK